MSALAVFFWLALSVGIGSFASSRGRSGILWGGLSLMFSPLAAGIGLGLMAATGSPKVVEPYLESAEEERFDPDEHEKKCRDCAEYIKLEARVCRYCGYEFSHEEVERQIAQVREDFRERSREEEQVETETTSVFSKKELVTIGALFILLVGVMVVGAIAASVWGG